MTYVCVYLLIGTLVAWGLYRLAGGFDEVGPISPMMIVVAIVLWPIVLSIAIYNMYYSKDL